MLVERYFGTVHVFSNPWIDFPYSDGHCYLFKFHGNNFSSEGYTYKDIEYEWSHGSGSSIKMSPDMRMSMFDLTGYPHDRENVTQVQGEAIIQFTVINF